MGRGTRSRRGKQTNSSSRQGGTNWERIFEDLSTDIEFLHSNSRKNDIQLYDHTLGRTVTLWVDEEMCSVCDEPPCRHWMYLEALLRAGPITNESLACAEIVGRDLARERSQDLISRYYLQKIDLDRGVATLVSTDADPRSASVVEVEQAWSDLWCHYCSASICEHTEALRAWQKAPLIPTAARALDRFLLSSESIPQVRAARGGEKAYLPPEEKVLQFSDDPSVPNIPAINGPAELLRSLGAHPVLYPTRLPDLETRRRAYERMPRIIIWGGPDIPRDWYETSASSARNPGIESVRDISERELVQWALEDGKPILGICRGCQLLNVVAGGSLYYDIDTNFPRTSRSFNHRYDPHAIQVQSGNPLQAVLGDRPHVNSFHHQAVNKLGEGFRAIAEAPDGVTEAIWAPGRAKTGEVLGLQFHPEYMAAHQPIYRQILARFVQHGTFVERARSRVSTSL